MHVRSAAVGLVDDLKAAQRETGDWAEQELAFALVETAMSTCLARLVETDCWGRENLPLSNELWQVAGPMLERGALQLRARSKPLGYAGDYLLVAQICQGDCCHDPLGRVFDRYFQGQAAVEAVRARTQQVGAALASRVLSSHSRQARGGFRVVSVGAGPAIDIERAARLLDERERSRLSVSLLDLDPEALEHARQRLAEVIESQRLVCQRDNLYRLAQRRSSAAALAAADFMVCSGLFDYLADEAAASLLRLLYTNLAPGGRLLVGNFAPHCPSRAYMEWIGNWYLLYRSSSDLSRLASEAGIPADAFRIGAERLGIDLFLVADKAEE